MDRDLIVPSYSPRSHNYRASGIRPIGSCPIGICPSNLRSSDLRHNDLRSSLSDVEVSCQFFNLSLKSNLYNRRFILKCFLAWPVLSLSRSTFPWIHSAMIWNSVNNLPSWKFNQLVVKWFLEILLPRRGPMENITSTRRSNIFQWSFIWIIWHDH